MNFKENEQGTAILDRLRSQKNMGQFCDVVLAVKGKNYQAHRNVLAACSPYFETLFLKISDIQQPITINCNNPGIFDTILEYLYTGSIVIDNENVDDVVKLANALMLSNLKLYCSEYLDRTLTVANCFTIRELGESCNLPSVVKKADAFLLANILDVISEKEMQAFSEHNFRKVFLFDKYMPLTEELKVHAICRWVSKDPEERHEAMARNLQAINWSKTSVSALYNMVRTDSLFLDNEWCLFHMLEIFEEHGILYSIYAETLRKLREKIAIKKAGDELERQKAEEAVAKTAPQLHDTGEKQHLQEIMVDSGNSKVKSESNFEQIPGDDLSRSELQKARYSAGAESESEHEGTDGEGLADPAMDNTDTSSGSDTDIGAEQYETSSADIVPDVQEEVVSTTEVMRKNRRKSKPRKVERSSEPFIPEIPLKKKRGRPRLYEPKQRRVKKLKGRRGRQKMDRLHCPNCNFETTKINKLELHTQRAHKSDKTYNCPFCEFNSKWNKEFYNHVKVHLPGPPHHCDFEGCDYTVDRVQILLVHRMNHTKERPYSCEVCNMSFRTQAALDVHKRTHTGEKPFQCSVCNRCFATKGTLQQHSVSHGNVRPYLCDSCGFSTKYQSHLIAHRRLHSGDVFTCQHPGCDYITPKRSQLGVHMRTHLSIRSHICTTCGRGFVEKGHLVRHERIHLLDRPFKCDLCEYTSTRRDKLKEHTKKYHDENSPTKTKQPFKPRRPRRQAFDPAVFPGLTQAQSDAELQLEMTGKITTDQITRTTGLDEASVGGADNTFVSVTTTSGSISPGKPLASEPASPALNSGTSTPKLAATTALSGGVTNTTTGCSRSSTVVNLETLSGMLIDPRMQLLVPGTQPTQVLQPRAPTSLPNLQPANPPNQTPTVYLAPHTQVLHTLQPRMPSQSTPASQQQNQDGPATSTFREIFTS